MRRVLTVCFAASLLAACAEHDGFELTHGEGESSHGAPTKASEVEHSTAAEPASHATELGDGAIEATEGLPVDEAHAREILYVFETESGVAEVEGADAFLGIEFHLAAEREVELRALDAAGNVVMDWTRASTFVTTELGHAVEGFLVLERPAQTIQVRSEGRIEFGRFVVSEEREPHHHENDASADDAVVPFVSRPGRWIPPNDVLAIANNQFVSYTGAPSSCSGTFRPGTREVAEFLKSTFEGATSYGGYACRANTANPNQYSVHASGRAIDLFVPLHNGDADNDLGDPIANYLIMHAEALGVEFVIWDRTSWGASRSAPKHRAYTGPHPHHDHLHIELSPASSTTTGRTFPGVCIESAEVCDGVDNDCNEQVDEGEVCEKQWMRQRPVTYAPPTTTDVDGDGKADVCGRGATGFWCHYGGSEGFADAATPAAPLSDENGWKRAMYFSTIRMGDIDGDGRADVCARASTGMFCWKFDGESWTRLDGPPLADEQGWDKIHHFSTIRLADYNGDGLDDICARAGVGYMCWPSTGDGFGGRIDGPAWSNEAGFTSAKYYGTLRTGDINGDRKQDVCIRDSEGITCALSTGNGFAPPFRGPAWSDAAGWHALQYWTSIRMADVDGDGRDDICARSAADVRCHLSEGEGFGPAIEVAALSDASGWNDVTNHATLRVGDIDGDGTDDICARANARVLCFTWNGQAFDRVDGPEWSDANGWNNPSNFDTLRLGDFDGDRKADLCGRAHAGWACRGSRGNEFSAESLVLSEFDTEGGWGDVGYYSTLQFAGPRCELVESCNGRDDDCNGLVDDDPVEAGEPCELADLPACHQATLVCTDGGLTCVATPDPDDPSCANGPAVADGSSTPGSQLDPERSSPQVVRAEGNFCASAGSTPGLIALLLFMLGLAPRLRRAIA